MSHPTYAEVTGWTKAAVFAYIVENSPDTHVAKSWSRDRLLNTYANAFPTEAPKKAKKSKAKARSNGNEGTITFGQKTTKYLSDAYGKPSEVSQVGRGRWAVSEDLLQALTDGATDDENSSIKPNLARAADRVARDLKASEQKAA
jgi:hypothetical protein